MAPPVEAPGERGVRLRFQGQFVILDNGIVELTLSKPEGMLTGIKYKGIDNLMEVCNKDSNRGYWDIVWNDPNKPNGKGQYDVIAGTFFSVIKEEEEQVEVSFTRTWKSSSDKMVPLSIDKRFIVLKNSSGFYTYAIFDHAKGWPDFDLAVARVVFKVRKDKFQYMAVAENRQRLMPFPEDCSPKRSETLAYPEATRLINPINADLKGEVDDKYQYVCDNKDNTLQGWICSNPPTGFWLITPSHEFRTGGPFKQNLTSHVGPTSLAVFVGAHYAGGDLVPLIRDGERWNKVFGPVFIYLNSASTVGKESDILWKDARAKAQEEIKRWPYDFPTSRDFQKPHERGQVRGRLLVRECHRDLPASFAYIGLASPGEVGSWQRESKGYQFWIQADNSGSFTITGIRTGAYNLYATVPGFIGDFKYGHLISINAGSSIDVGIITFEPPREGPTIWEIGFPSRTAEGFFVPDPDPLYINKLYVNHPDRFRQYGLWDRYTELYPKDDLLYTIGTNDCAKDWFFAQVPRRISSTNYIGTTWKIKFTLDDIVEGEKYTLRVAIAAMNLAELQIRFNNEGIKRPHFTTGLAGRDNAIARHGIHGLYVLYNIHVQSKWLVKGENTIFLTQPRAISPFQGIMYDYIRLEGPSGHGMERGSH